MVYNPAYTGTDDAANVMLVNHTQWTGFKGAPQYNLLTFDGNVLNKNTGLGVSIANDRRGVTNRIGGNVSYSYKLRFKKNIHLLLGLSAGAINQSINYSNAIVENPNDPSLFSNTQNKTTFDANAGLAFICRGFELGFAIPQIANNKINYVANNDTRVFYTQSRHYMSSIKYKFLISKEITLNPLLLARYVPNTPIQYDANLNLNWQNKFWIGATYKNNYALGLNLGVVIYKRFSIGYSYDYMLGSISKYAGLSHEIMLNFKFIKHKKDTALNVKSEDELLKKLASQNLNKLIIERLLQKIENVLDKGNATPEEIHAILDEISSFLDDESIDPMQETLNKYYQSLKHQAEGDINVLVKGKIIFENNDPNNDFLNVTIMVSEFGSKKIIAACKPTLKDGKYYIILKPGKKYIITTECVGYQKLIKELSIAATRESYELNSEIRLKK